MSICILQRVGQIDSAADVLNSKRRKSCRKVWIGESSGYRDSVKRAIEDIDFTVMKIGCIQAATSRSTVNREPFINGIMRSGVCVGDDGHNRGALECRDRAVLAREDESCRTR